MSEKLNLSVRNMIVFAKAFPLLSVEEHVQVNQICDNREFMTYILQDCQQNIQVKYEVLNLNFLRSIKSLNSKILHLVPYMN